jgi:hypothetical protein
MHRFYPVNTSQFDGFEFVAVRVLVRFSNQCDAHTQTVVDTVLDEDEEGGGAHSRQQRRPQRQLALACYLHRSFLEHTIAPSSSIQSAATSAASLLPHCAEPLFSVGRRICLTNLAFSRTTASSSSSSVSRHQHGTSASAAPALHLLPTPYALPVLDPWRCDADRARLAAYAPNGLRTALGTRELEKHSEVCMNTFSE